MKRKEQLRSWCRKHGNRLDKLKNQKPGIVATPITIGKALLSSYFSIFWQNCWKTEGSGATAG